MIIVTGGAGFIGSCVVRELNEMGYEDIVIVDHIHRTEKWKNLRNKRYREYITRDEFLNRLSEFQGIVSHVIHMGACSSTTETDFDFLYHNNGCYTKTLWDFCARQECSFLYASSAATYGAGEYGFDDGMDLTRLRPLNGYGYSKHLFDLWAQKQQTAPKQHCGLKFFNVYGPNEYCKGNMASVVFHAFQKIKQTGEMGIFRSYREDYEDGGQMRDFIYVKDLCKVMRYLMEHPGISGLFNLGTGRARSFYDLAGAVFDAMGVKRNIQFIEMPETLREKYQYFTQAKTDQLRATGYEAPFYSLEEGVSDYVKNYLAAGYEVY